MSIYTNPLFMKQDGWAPAEYSAEELVNMFGDETKSMRRTYSEFTHINKREINEYELSATISNFGREAPHEEQLLRFVKATDGFVNNKSMLKIMDGDSIDRSMSRAIFKYICPDREKMDKNSFRQFVEQFGLNTHGLNTDDLFAAICGGKRDVRLIILICTYR